MLYHNDALTQLKLLESESIDLVCTSPPYYSLRDYNTEEIIWDCYEKCDHDFNSQHTLLLGNNRNGLSTGIIRSRANNPNITTTYYICSKCNAWKGSLGLEPTPQLYIQHLIQVFRECKRVLKKTGSLWVNIGDSYNGNKSLIGIPERLVIAVTDDLGLIRRNTIIWHKNNALPSSTKDRFTTDFEYFYFFVKSPTKYYFDTQYEPYKQESIERAAKGFKTDNTKYKSCDTGVGNLRCGSNPLHPQGRIKRTVWTINTQPLKEAHFAVFPEQLVITPILSCCPQNGTVLDPFMGAGTTGLVAKKLGRSFVGIELNKEYIDIARKRIDSIL